MSGAASLPGADFFPENRCFLKQPLVPGSFAAWGRTFSRKYVSFYKKQLVPRSFAARQNLCRKLTFLKKPLVPGSFAAWGRTFFPENRLKFFQESPGGPLLWSSISCRLTLPSCSTTSPLCLSLIPLLLYPYLQLLHLPCPMVGFSQEPLIPCMPYLASAFLR